MSSISPANSAIANLVQTLSNDGAPVAQSQSAVSGIENAPPVDIADLSEAANRLSEADAILNAGAGAPAAPTGGNAVLQAYQQSLSDAASEASD